MPDRLFDTVRSSVQEIAETMLFVEIAPGIHQHDRCSLDADVSAVIGYGGALRGSLRLAGTTDVMLRLAGTLVGEDREEVDKEMEDAFCELANMIAGGVQTRLEGSIGAIMISPPVLITGQNHKVTTSHTFLCSSHQFVLNGMPFFTEIFYADDSAIVVKNNEESSSSSDETAVVKLLKQHFGPRLKAMAREKAYEMVRKHLPEVAEQQVRREIDRLTAQSQQSHV